MKHGELAAAVKTLRNELERTHLAGAGGFDVCHKWSDTVDGLILGLFNELAGGLDGLPFALAAVGGYGRRELNPYSDVDLLFLYEKNVSKAGGELPGRAIPALWDIGFKVGHSTRTIDDCMKIGQNDLTSKTAMMEARFLLGNKETYTLFERRFRKTVVSKQVERFLREKWAETEARHETFSNSCFLTEPDVKESPGGLRDYHLAVWTASARYEVRGIREMFDRGLLGADEAGAAEASVDFLLRVRNDVHFVAQTAHNQLDYGIQKKVAQRLGYEGPGDEPVVDMMRTYFMSAETVFRLCQSIHDQARRYRTKTQMFSLRLRPREIGPSIFAGDDEIFVKGVTAEELAMEPKRIFLLLRLIVEKAGLPSNGLIKTLEKVGTIWKRGKPAFPVLGEGLRSVLSLDDPVRALRLMRDCKLMTTVIPEFRAIRYLTPFDMYHKFTVGEHTFRAVGEFDNLKRNERPECDVLSALYAGEKRRDLVRLALLLHDIGKGKAGHEDHETLDPAIMERLGYPPEDAAVVVKLVKLHLRMNNVAQRRDIRDANTIVEFCQLVGDQDTLRRLYLLTYADTSSVGQGVWTSWKGTLLRELFLTGAAYFEGMDPVQWLAKGRFVPGDKMTPQLGRFIRGMPDKYFFLRTPEQVEADGAFFDKFLGSDAPARLRYVHDDAAGAGELTLASRNRVGLLYNVVGVFSSKNVDIHEAQIFTHKEEVAFDVFRVTGPNGVPINDPVFWDRVSAEICRVLSGERSVDELMRSRKKLISVQPNAPQVDALVKTLNDVSYDHTVIETTSKDRIGLLYDITRAISGMNADIVSARIAVEGLKAVNTFYVREPNGGKITDPDRLEEIKSEVGRALLHVV